MAVTVSKPAINIRDILAKLANIEPPKRTATEVFEGDTTTTTFAVTRGFKPKAVYVDGLRFTEGALEDYTVSFDGFLYSVVFAVAPAAVKIIIDTEEAQ